MTDLIQRGPCIGCGAVNYPLSMGGSMLCPFCDCYPPSESKLRQENAALRAHVAALVQAMRLHLAVSPDDPVLLTPVEQQFVAMRQERDEARSQRDFAKEDRDLYYQRWEAVSRERDAFIRGGVTEELLRKQDGYLKVGKGCVLVREDDWQQAQQALSQQEKPCEKE